MAAMSKSFHAGDFQAADRPAGVGMDRDGAVLADAAEGPPALQVDARGDRPLVQIRPAARLPRRQADHGHHRHAAIEHDADVGGAADGDRLEDRMADDPLLDDDPVGLPGQGIEAGEDRRQVIGHFGQRQSLVAGVVELAAVVPGDDHDAASLAAAGRLDDELLAMADQVEKFRHVAVPLDQGVGLRDGDLPPAAKLLGQVPCRPRGDSARGDCSGSTYSPLRRLMPRMPACRNSCGVAQGRRFSPNILENLAVAREPDQNKLTASS